MSLFSSRRTLVPSISTHSSGSRMIARVERDFSGSIVVPPFTRNQVVQEAGCGVRSKHFHSTAVEIAMIEWRFIANVSTYIRVVIA